MPKRAYRDAEGLVPSDFGKDGDDVLDFSEPARFAKVIRPFELNLLSAYVYYQMDRPEEAKSALKALPEEWVSSPAIGILKAAIV
jgi:hypothetical protein